MGIASTGAMPEDEHKVLNHFIPIMHMDSNEQFWIIASFVVGALTLIIPFTVYIVQQQSRNAQFFKNCTNSLQSDNPIEQSTAAILLRGFLKRPWWKFLYKPNYTKETKNLMVSLLNDKPISVSLQKTVADGFSYASNLKGQDMQYVNMLGALIKPKYRIKYELAENPILKAYYKHRRISFRNADFFHAVLQECSINNVNAKGVVFLSSILCRTSFKNCVFKNANFENSNVHKVKFDQDCILDGASFKGAIGIETATKKVKGEKDARPLIEFLDKNGIFHSTVLKQEERYVIKNEKINIFISKLGSMDSKQRMHYDSAISTIEKLGNVEIQKIERDQYPPVSQLTDIATHLDNCDGCVIFAFGYLNVTTGFIHKNVEGEDKRNVDKTIFSSPWLHIEAALANGKQIPCLIVYEENLCRDGMFDETIIQSDKNMFSMPYTDTLSVKDRNMLYRWFSLVREYYYNKNVRGK